MNNFIQAERLKQFLLKIYRCKKDFELLVIDKKPKTRMGVYIVDKKRIRVYSKWICATPLEEVAIQSTNRRLERVHGPEFWRIYSALCCKASLSGMFHDELISDII